MFQWSLPVLARLAAEAGDMKLATSVLLLPLLNPVDVAEQVATLDHISEGPLILGLGLGYRPEEYEAFGTRSCHETAERLVAETNAMEPGPLMLLGISARVLNRWEAAESAFRKVTEFCLPITRVARSSLTKTSCS